MRTSALVAVVGLAMTALATTNLHATWSDPESLRLAELSSDSTAEMVARMASAETTLRNAAGLFEALEGVDEEEFRTFMQVVVGGAGPLSPPAGVRGPRVPARGHTRRPRLIPRAGRTEPPTQWQLFPPESEVVERMHEAAAVDAPLTLDPGLLEAADTGLLHQVPEADGEWSTGGYVMLLLDRRALLSAVLEDSGLAVELRHPGIQPHPVAQRVRGDTQQSTLGGIVDSRLSDRVSRSVLLASKVLLRGSLCRSAMRTPGPRDRSSIGSVCEAWPGKVPVNGWLGP